MSLIEIPGDPCPIRTQSAPYPLLFTRAASLGSKFSPNISSSSMFSSQILETIDLFSALGVEVAISELDIDILPEAWFCLDAPGAKSRSRHAQAPLRAGTTRA